MEDSGQGGRQARLEREARRAAAVKDRDRARVAEVERRLREAYGQPRHQNPEDPLDDLVFVMLSRMTQQRKYVRTYRALRRRYPSWERLLEAESNEIVSLLQDAGLAETKARQTREVLAEVRRREGQLSLQRLRELPDEEAQAYLTSLPGVGVKTAQCVLLYALGRDVCPVDAHVWRIGQRLGLAPAGPWSERAASRLEAALPAGLRASLHVTMVAHGRRICLARVPRCESCVLEDLCPSSRAP